MHLTSEVVHDTFMKCLYTEEEVEDPSKAPEGAIISEGITLNVGFHPGRIAENKQLIIDMLNELPGKFFMNKGGGYTFTGMNVDRNGNCWANTESTMQELVLLGQAVGAVLCCAPREIWDVLPGGLPYYVIDTSENPFTVKPKNIDEMVSDDEYENEIRKMFH